MIAIVAAYLAVGVALFPLGRADLWTLHLAAWLLDRRLQTVKPPMRPLVKGARDAYGDRILELDDLPVPLAWIVGWPIFAAMMLWSAVKMLRASWRWGGR